MNIKSKFRTLGGGSAILVTALWLALPNAPRADELAVQAGDIYPQGEVMLFSMYALRKAELKTALADGLTSIGPYSGPTARKNLERWSKTSKLPWVYSAGKKLDIEGSSATELDKELAELTEEIKRLANNPAVSVWNLRNEEMRHWKPKEMDFMRRAASIIRENDPLNRPIMMYEPNHRDTAALKKTGVYTDFIAKGAYANHVGMKDKRTWVRLSVEQTVEAASALDKTPVAVLWMAADQEPQDVAKIAAWTRHDAYLSLVLGAKGLLVWSASSGREGFSKHFKNFYAGYSSVAQELNGEQQLAQIFLFGERVDDIELKVSAGPATQTFNYLDARFEYPSLSHVRFEHDDKQYLFIVNSVDESVTAKVSGALPAAETTDVFSNEPMELTAEQTLQAYEVRGFVWDN